MKEHEKPLRYKLLTALVLALCAAVVVQGYFLYRLHEYFTNENTKTDVADAAGQPGIQHFSVPLNSGPPAPQNPYGSFFNTPFDPDTWNPFSDIDQLQHQMEKMLDETFKRFNSSPLFDGFSRNTAFSPKSDVEETDQAYIVHLDIPGADKSKIEASLEDRTLTITGIREEQSSQQDRNKNVYNERRFGEFRRTLTLPGPVKQGDMKTEYKDGVFTLVIPKDVSAPKK